MTNYNHCWKTSNGIFELLCQQHNNNNNNNNICPLLKKGPRTDVTNYRQISLLSIVSKLCERCVLSNLIPELADLLSALRHSFCPFWTTLGQPWMQGMRSIWSTLTSVFSVWLGSTPPSSSQAWFVRHLGSPSLLVLGLFAIDFQISEGVPQVSLLAPFPYLLYVIDLPSLSAHAPVWLSMLMMRSVIELFVVKRTAKPCKMICTVCLTGLHHGD